MMQRLDRPQNDRRHSPRQQTDLWIDRATFQAACRLNQGSCVDLIGAADMLRKINDKLRISCSVSLY